VEDKKEEDVEWREKRCEQDANEAGSVVDIN
jgi:hypothetical protein